jgi:hypothetical protein
MKIYSGGGASAELPNSGVEATSQQKSDTAFRETAAPIVIDLSYLSREVIENNKKAENANGNSQQKPALQIERTR